MDEIDLVELFAARAHVSWGGWLSWMIEQWDRDHLSGERFIDRWRRQARTPYADLPEREKESDRIEARAYIAILKDKGIL